ncbi:bifunctional folylpolyglutamate synthase/dihydrofolate synthase [Sulfoacidibacillus thermotolerans]|uniref:tetrahydrofolate synthase n=1 Tax=Sulfoacidibacillus thermotolerans TaxID=1765684 RepID=A0A2U3DC34_SULT2|nr:folylpolyglutamate synthase/dihydrofolate synthase family protein [Sulfoacidibacillus thermotolerans]PWI58841.1 hypothetical protein BM613_01765 [Sulfoacidibacillus thermotolerans]
MSLSVDVSSTLAYIQSRARFGVKPGLERILYLLNGLGSPHDRLRFVHVAGTNGKGSTCVYTAQILQAAGYRVGLYTSPYLTAFAERMSVNGDPITAFELVQFTEQVRRVAQTVEGNPLLEPTEFEVITAVSMLFFLARNVDLVVLETGLGGRYDATNVVWPEVCALTNVALDHTEILGKRVEEIAFDKSGIIKKKIPVFTGADSQALSVIERIANEQQSPLWVLSRDLHVVFEGSFGVRGQRFSYFGMRRDYLGLQTRMLGSHQLKNAAIALGLVEALRERGFAISDEAVRTGIATAKWPGRLEVIQEDPLVLLDGAHNPAAAHALAQALKDLAIDRFVLVIGVLGDKDIEGIVHAIIKDCVHIVVTEPDVPRAAPVERLKDVVLHHVGADVPVETVREVSSAVQRAVRLAKDLSLPLCIMGSLYTVAQAKAIFMQQAEGKYAREVEKQWQWDR